MWRSPERICVTADGKLCEETDPAAMRLLVAKGGEIPAAEAAKYGLIATTGPEETPPAAREAPKAEAEEAPVAERERPARRNR